MEGGENAWGDNENGCHLSHRFSLSHMGRQAVMRPVPVYTLPLKAQKLAKFTESKVKPLRKLFKSI